MDKLEQIIWVLRRLLFLIVLYRILFERVEAAPASFPRPNPSRNRRATTVDTLAERRLEPVQDSKSMVYDVHIASTSSAQLNHKFKQITPRPQPQFEMPVAAKTGPASVRELFPSLHQNKDDLPADQPTRDLVNKPAEPVAKGLKGSLPAHAMREPVIFEPKPTIFTSGGTYDMLLIYKVNSIGDEVSRFSDFVNTAETHWKNVITKWRAANPETDRADDRMHPFPGQLDGHTDFADIKTRQAFSTPRGRLFYSLYLSHMRLTEDANKLMARSNRLYSSIERHRSGKEGGHIPIPSPDPYHQGRSKRSVRETQENSNSKTFLDALKELASLPWKQKKELDHYLTLRLEEMCKKHSFDCQIEWPNHSNSTRVKRFWGLLNLIGVVVNGHRIDQLGEKVETLLANDEIMDKQIHHVANYLNMTMIRVATLSRNQMRIQVMVHHLGETLEKMLLEQTKDTQFNNWYQMLLQEDRIMQSLYNKLQKELDHLEKTLLTVQSHKLTPDLVSPEELYKYLESIENDLLRKPRLKLPGDFREDIWSFYAIIRVQPILRNHVIILVCTIPLQDTATQLDIYRVHSLPTIHGPSSIMAEYRLEGKYFAVSKDRTWVAIPQEETMFLCEASGQHVCHLNAPLIPRTKCNLCLCALFEDIATDQTEKIKKNCFVSVKAAKSSRAVSFDGDIWAVVVPEDTTLFKHCHDRPERVTITPPVTFVNLTGGCYAFTDDLYLTSQAHMSNVAGVIDRWSFMKRFEPETHAFDDLRLWTYLKPNTTTLDQLKEWKLEKLPYLPSELPVGDLDKHIKNFSMDSFWKWGKWQKWSSSISILLIILTGIAALIYCLYRRGVFTRLISFVRAKRAKTTESQLESGSEATPLNPAAGDDVRQSSDPPPYEAAQGETNPAFSANEKKPLPNAPPEEAQQLVPYNPKRAAAQVRAARALNLAIQEELNKPRTQTSSSLPDPDPENLTNQLETVAALPDLQKVQYVKHLQQFLG